MNVAALLQDSPSDDRRPGTASGSSTRLAGPGVAVDGSGSSGGGVGGGGRLSDSGRIPDAAVNGAARLPDVGVGIGGQSRGDQVTTNWTKGDGSRATKGTKGGQRTEIVEGGLVTVHHQGK